MTGIASALPAGLTRAQPDGAKGGGELGQAEFLRLMTAQLKFQDPFDPVDNQQMVAQMAQFSSVAGIAEMNQSLKAIAASFGTARLADASAFIGRSVLVEGDVAAINPGGRYAGELSLAAPAENLTIEFIDEAGGVVRSIAVGAAAEGKPIAFGFDSLDAAGNPVDLGNLKVRVSGAAPASIATWLPVNAAGSAGAGADAVLITPIGEVPTGAARRIG